MRVLQIQQPVDREKLEHEFKKEKNVKRRNWLHIILLVLDHQTAIEIANELFLNEKTVRRVVKRFNQNGMDGLAPNHPPGAPRRMSPEQERILRNRLEAGPTEEDEVSVFHAADVRKIIQDEFGIKVSKSTTYHVLHRLGFSYLSPRPKHPKGDVVQQESFKKGRDATNPLRYSKSISRPNR